MTPKYHKTGEAVDRGKHGKNFEKDLSELLFKRVVDTNFKDFDFTIEKKGVGKFDDIIIISEEKGKGKEIRLAQLKHKENENDMIDYDALTVNKKIEFYLPKYYDYYLESRETISKDADFDNATLKSLYMCTNVLLKDDLGTITKVVITEDPLFKKDALLVKINIPDDLKQEIFSLNYISTRHRLAIELVESLMIRTHIDITSMIKDENASFIKDYHQALVEHVIDSDTKGFKTQFLNPSTNDEVKKLLDCFFDALDKFHEKYKDHSEEDLKRTLDIKDSKKAQDLMKRLQHYDARKSVEDFLSKQKFDIKNNFFKSSQDAASQTSLPPDEDIKGEKVDQEIDQFLDLLIFVTDLRDVKSITTKETPSELYTAFRHKFDQWFDFGVIKDKDTCKREWLSKETLSTRAMECCAKFQGKEIKVKQLVDDDKNLFTPDLLTRVFCCQDISVGQPPPEQSCHYYIPRILRRYNTHSNEEEIYSEEDLFESDLKKANKLCVIVGEPGMGKTTFVHNISQTMSTTKELDSGKPSWIINIPLNACTKALKNLTFHNMEQVISFFSEIQELEDEFSKTLLRKFLDSEGKVKVFLDGLDEVTEIERENVLRLVEFLRENTSVDAVWITTRTHLQEKLEEHFQEVSFSLDKFNEQDQVSLLVNYWKCESEENNEIKLKKFANEMVKKVNKNIDKNVRSFLGIPLQVYMVGFIFQDEVSKENPVIPDILTLASLYDKFVEEKCNIYFYKEGLDQVKDYIKDMNRKTAEKCYTNLALPYINAGKCEKDYKKLIAAIKCPSEDELTVCLKIGIISKKGDEVYFIHQTFAEYFVAKFFTDIYKGEQIVENKEEWLKIIPTMLELPSNRFLMILFDLKVASDFPFHFAVLKGEKEKVEEFKEEINEKDYVGRTFLYYALKYEHDHILEIIMKKKISVHLSDRFLPLLTLFRFSAKMNPLDWNEKRFLRFASYVKFALYILHNEDNIVEDEGERIPFHWTRKDLLERTQDYIDEAKIIYQELNFDFSEVEPKSLPEKIKILKGKKVPLIEAHRYFQRNGERLFNLQENELPKFLESQKTKKHFDVIAKSPSTAPHIIENVCKGHLLKFKMQGQKRPSQILDEVKRRCRNLFLIMKTFILWKIQIPSLFSFFLPVGHLHYGNYYNIIESCKTSIKMEPSFVDDILEPLGKLNEMATHGHITDYKAKHIKSIWTKCQLQQLNLSNTTLQKAILTVIRSLLDSSDAFQFQHLFYRLTSAIDKKNKAKVLPLLRQIKKRGWFDLVLRYNSLRSNTLEDLARNEAESGDKDAHAILKELIAARV